MLWVLMVNEYPQNIFLWINKRKKKYILFYMEQKKSILSGALQKVKSMLLYHINKIHSPGYVYSNSLTEVVFLFCVLSLPLLQNQQPFVWKLRTVYIRMPSCTKLKGIWAPGKGIIVTIIFERILLTSWYTYLKHADFMNSEILVFHNSR